MIDLINFDEFLDILEGHRIMGVFGVFGKGKTLTTTFLSDVFINVLKKENLYSNYPIKHEPIEPILSLNQFLSLKKSSLIVIDEIQRFFPFGLSPNSPATKIFLNFGQNLRKDDTTFLYASQRLWGNKVIRDMTTLKIFPEFEKIYSSNPKKDIPERITKKDFYTVLGIEEVGQDQKYLIINLYDFLNNYDTNYKVNEIIKDDENSKNKIKKADRFEYERNRNEEIDYERDRFFEHHKKLLSK